MGAIILLFYLIRVLKEMKLTLLQSMVQACNYLTLLDSLLKVWGIQYIMM